MLSAAFNQQSQNRAGIVPRPDPVETQRFVRQAGNLLNLLSGTNDLTPRNHAVNKALDNFLAETLRLRSGEEIAAILEQEELDDIVPDLRDYYRKAISVREKFCAKAILGQEFICQTQYSKYSQLPSLPYYAALVSNELEALGWPLKRPPIKPDQQSIALVGSGPLPLSAIILYLRTGLHVTCVDSDPEVCDLGRRLIRHLAATEPRCADLERNVTYRHARGEECDYITHPIVFIASMASNKDAIMMRVAESCNTASTILVRSTEQLGMLLYEPYNPPGGTEFYNIYLIRKRGLTDKILHSAQVYRMPPGKLFARNKVHTNTIAMLAGFVPMNDTATIAPHPKRRWRTGGPGAARR